MKLYETWENMQELCKTESDSAALWNEYYLSEKEAYKKVLGEKQFSLSGTAKELADKLGLETAVFAAFVDGINTSLTAEVDVKEMEEETAVCLNIVPEKLFYNMLSAKAKWLYTLPEWNDILDEEKRTEITRTWRKEHMAVSEKKTGRNDPCPCGSGKKYKNCCGKA